MTSATNGVLTLSKGSRRVERRLRRPIQDRAQRCQSMNDPNKKSTTRYYHGGNRGLKVGQFILPPSETGKESATDFGAAKVHRKDRVYVSTRLEDAQFF